MTAAGHSRGGVEDTTAVKESKEKKSEKVEGSPVVMNQSHLVEV